MPGSDPTHWLHRLDAAEWLAAAATELDHARAALERRATRVGITHARRAAGMAWNAVLVVAPTSGPTSRPTSIDRYGRSYMEHVVALAQADDTGDGIPDDVRAAARLLRDTPPRPPELVTIGKPDMAPLMAARAIADYASRYVSENG